MLWKRMGYFCRDNSLVVDNLVNKHIMPILIGRKLYHHEYPRIVIFVIPEY